MKNNNNKSSSMILFCDVNFGVALRLKWMISISCWYRASHPATIKAKVIRESTRIIGGPSILKSWTLIEQTIHLLTSLERNNPSLDAYVTCLIHFSKSCNFLKNPLIWLIMCRSLLQPSCITWYQAGCYAILVAVRNAW